MTYILILAALALPLLVWAAIRGYMVWSPGQGSSVPGVTFQAFPAAIPQVVTGSAAAAAINLTIPAANGKVTWIEGVDITGLGATAAGTANLTISGLAGGATLTYTLAIAAGVAAPAFSINANVFSIRFSTPLPAGTAAGILANTAITLTMASFGAGNTSAIATAYGFQV